MATNELLRKELERYKSLYEHEKEQFEEYQRYSKELETELEIELSHSTKKIGELEAAKRRLNTELDSLKVRYEQERKDYLSNEQQYKSRLQLAEDTCHELRQKLRVVEQANDDLERRERIQAQELTDFSIRYDKCLERCALLETGMAGPNAEAMDYSPSVSVCNGSNSFTSTNNGDTTTADVSLNGSGFSSHVDEKRKHGGDFKRASTGSGASSVSSAIVGQLIRKIEEVEKQVDPSKFVVRRSPIEYRQPLSRSNTVSK